MNNRTLITGATGFIGRAVLSQLAEQGMDVRAAVRNAEIKGRQWVAVGNIDRMTDWSQALSGIDCVIHLAARLHQLSGAKHGSLSLYRTVNVNGSVRLARQAAEAGVLRFVYLSTAKVYGESSDQQSFHEKDAPAPQDPYAVSKWEAEQALTEIALDSGMELSILRPPLVYGPGVGANFLRLIEFVEREKLLPFGRVDNRRSLIGLSSLVDAIQLCATHENAAGQCFNISDNEDLSTAELIKRLARDLHVRARLINVPPSLLQFAAIFTGQRYQAARLLGSFRVDSSHLRQTLNWRPRSSSEELKKLADWYKAATLGRT